MSKLTTEAIIALLSKEQQIDLYDKLHKQLYKNSAKVFFPTKIYKLRAYYYERGEHWSGYQTVKCTTNKDTADKFKLSPPTLDERGTRPNVVYEIEGYRDERGYLYNKDLKLFNR